MISLSVHTWAPQRAALVADLARASGQPPGAVHAVLDALHGSMTASLNQGTGGYFTVPGLFHITASRVPTFRITTAHPFTKVKGLFLVDSHKLELSTQWLDTFSCVGVWPLAPPRARRRRGAAAGDS